MDKLLGWVKQIFVISILSELVIHILPDEKYEGVVRLLCGCMITAACIMPVLNIINAEYDADIDLFAKTSQISELRSQIRFSGKDSSDVMIEKYIDKYEYNYDYALIGKNDRIIPPENQEINHEEAANLIITDCAHYDEPMFRFLLQDAWEMPIDDFLWHLKRMCIQ